jgi:GAF domain-containing protein
MMTKVLREVQLEEEFLASSDPSAFGLSTLSSVQDVFLGLLQLTLKGVGASSGSILIVDESGNVKEGARSYAGSLQPAAGQEFTEIVEHGLAGWVLENRQPTLVMSTWDDPRWLRRAWDEEGYSSRSAISLPLISEDRICGILTLAHSEAGQFTSNDLSMLAAITVCISLVNPSHDNRGK